MSCMPRVDETAAANQKSCRGQGVQGGLAGLLMKPLNCFRGFFYFILFDHLIPSVLNSAPLFVRLFVFLESLQVNGRNGSGLEV